MITTGPPPERAREDDPPQTPRARPALALADIEVVLVTYRSAEPVRALLDSWPEELAVTVVDNSGPDPSLAEVLESRAGGRYLEGGGQGFARAANLGARSAHRSYLIFVNPDSRPTAQHLLALVTGLAADQGAAAHGGTVVDPCADVEIGAGGWEPSVRRTAVHATGLHKWLPTSGLFARPEPGKEVDVDWVCGACLAVRTAQFIELGGFDETFFVYAEDISFGRRARTAGLRSVLRPDILVPHAAGSSGAPSTEMLRMRGASFACYVQRYHSPGHAFVMRALFGGGLLLRAVRHGIRCNRAEARLQIAMTRGLLTQRAYVGGIEVATSRFRETS
jgi:GT2 family glycosyltransferase